MRSLKQLRPVGKTSVISSDCVYARVAEGKWESREEQVWTIAVWMRSSNGRLKWDVNFEKLWPSKRRIAGVSGGSLES